MDWIGMVRLTGGVLGIVAVPLIFASVLHRDPNAPWAAWPPVLLHKQRAWYSPTGFRLRVAGEVLWTVGIFLCLMLPALVDWLD
jgi:hypothetical protein